MDDVTGQGFLLSPQQRRLWLLQQGGAATVYRAQGAVRIEGELNREALREALREVVSRHEILRTAFRVVPGMELPLQVILDPEPLPLRELDLSGLDTARREAGIADLFPAGRPGLDLDRGVVLLVSLVRLAPREHLLLLELPALCADPATFENLTAEVAAAYARACGLDPVEDEAAPMQYADLADWQNQLLESDDSAEHLDRWREYWREREIAAHLGASLPFEREEAGPTPEPFEPAALPVPLPLDLVEGIEGLLREWEVTVPLFVLAAWQILLRKSTGRPDVLVGVLHDGRRYEELRSALGPLARFLPVHVHLPDTLTPREVATLTREADEEVARRQERFSWAHLQGNVPRPPFFPVCFEAGEATREHAFAGIRFSIDRRQGVLDRFKLALACTQRRGVYELELRYDPRRFRRESAELLADRFQALLREIVEWPEAPLRELEGLGRRERALLERFRHSDAAAAAEPRQGAIHRLFAAQAGRTPDRPAVWHAGSHLTYAELDARANRLAHHLITAGIGLETPVAICLERSAEMVVAILGILKAGGAWVPLDPTHPPERMAHVLEDAGVPVLLTTEALLGSLPPENRAGVRVILLDREAEAIARRPGSDPEAEVPADALAYAIYTSGSTGRPKGVMVQHRSAVNLLAALETAALGAAGPPPLRASLNAPLAFDASVQQLVLLLAGHTLFVVPEEVRTDGTALLRFLRDHALDLFDCTPSQLRILLAGGLLAAAGPVPRVVLVAGEPIDGPTWSALAQSGRTVFFNVYGPTECTVDATAHRIGTPPAGVIGRPLAGYEASVLDAALRPVPLGAPGELAVGGAGLARGYRGRPDLTAERFVPDPSGARPGARVYRTGDLARFLPSGHLEFLGRIDHQVKIRGYRIEPGEIESVLLEHPWVREAAAVVRQTGEGALLAAYLLPSAEAPAGFDGSPEDLHAFLRRRLPVYMIPAAFVAVPGFPLTGSGKVDRLALAQRPLPERKGPRPGAPRVEPETATERALAEIWREILRLDGVSIADNFFQLGGDSILSIQVISRARQRGIHLTARQMFEHQTIAELARVAGSGPRTTAEDGAVTGPVPLTPIQRGYFGLGLVHPEHYNQTLLLQAAPEEGRLAMGALRRALGLLLEHHDALRMRFEPPPTADADWRQRNEAAGGEPPIVEIDLSVLPADRRAGALESAAATLQRSLDLTAGPLVRAAVFHVGSMGPDRFLMSVHHLVVDGVSWRILLEDLESLYRGLADGGEVALPPRTTSFRRWAERLVEHARDAAVVAQAERWLELLRSPAPILPVDHESGGNTVASTASILVSLGPEETRALLQEVPRAYRTQINDVLLTAVVEAFAGWTGSRRLWIDLEGHGREEVFPDLDVSRTVGWFTTVYPVLVDLEGTTAAGEALTAVKEQLRAVPERGFPYGLVRYLGDAGARRRLAAVPHPEVIFNYLGQLDQAVAAGRLFRGARESAGPGRSERHARTHLIEINGSVAGGRLSMVWTYSESRHRRGTVEALAGRFAEALRALIAHCASPEAAGYTPADFPLAALDRETLDRLATTAGRVEDVYPATPMQQGLLFHSRLEPRSGAHIGRLSLLFQGAVDPAAFERAWARVLARHAVLRTGFFGLERDQPLQVVRPAVPVPLEILDWRDLPGEERRERLAAYMEETLRRGFDASRPPLLRLALIRVGEETWRFVWLHHHAILDGWSLPLLLRELLTFYEAGLGGAEVELERPPEYREYIAWLADQDLGAAEAFWRRELAGFRAPTPLAGEGGAAAADPLFGSVTDTLPRETADTLRALARRGQLTVNTLVQGAWALWLRAQGGGDDVVFGVVTSGRSAPVDGIDAMVGLFVNTLPARLILEPAAELIPWLRKLQERQVEQRQLEHSPLLQVQAWSEIPRGMPLFETLIAFENFPVDEAVQEQAGRTMGIAEAETFEQSSYPLALAASLGPSLFLKITYDPRRFGGAWAARALGHLRNLLTGMAARPEARLSELPVLSAAERRELVLLGGAEPLETATLPERIGELARRSPEAVAAAFGDAALSYGELDRRANRLARHLLRRGVEPGWQVGLAVERSPEMLVGILGIWKAGAAYVPLDPEYPADRLRWIAEDAGLRLVVAEAAVLERLPLAGIAAVCLDADGMEIARESAAAPPRVIAPELPAYVIYTSGSTGRPKGVVVPHGGLPNLAAAQSRLFGVHPGSRVLQFASPSFDASVSEIGMALWAGATLVLSRRESLLPGPGLAALLREQRVTTVTLPPSALVVLPHEDLPDLETLVVAGETCAIDLARRWGAGRRLFNAYGPTETTVCATAGLWDGGDRLPLGRPLAGMEIRLLDGWGNPAPAGVAGEICVSGRGLAQGYLGLPERTAERFVPHPGAERPGERLYRTGDLARLGTDGTLELMGRIDRQVKVRGVRVEPGEVEAVLRSHPGILDAAVVARPDAAGGMALVACVVAREQGVADAELRGFLRERLPEPLVPARYAFLAALPLTPNGKVDRDALAGPASLERPATGVPAFRGPTEELLAGIFAEVLGLPAVGPLDGFFDLGGHSLLATRVTSRAQTAFGIELPLRDLFDHPSVRALAERVESRLRQERGREVPPLAPVPRGGGLPLSFAQERLWFLDQLLPGLPTYNMPLALALRGELSWSALAAGLSVVVARHEALRTVFTAVEGRPLQVIRPAPRIAPPVVDLAGLTEDRRWQVTRELAAADAARPFDLERGPLLRVSLLRLDAALHVALLNVHHIVYDGWSAGVLVGELGEAYTALLEDRPPALPRLAVQYADFAVWQRAWLAGAELERQLDYWRRQLAGAPALLDLPLDRPRLAVPAFRGAWAPAALPPATARALAALARTHGATSFMVLLAGFQALLARFSGQEDLVVGTPVANRNRPETEGVIGFFVNTLPLRGRPAGGLTFAEWLSQVRETALGAYAHQDLPFEKLVDEVRPERSLAHTPLFQALLVLQNAPAGRLDLPGLAFETVAAGTSAAKFDLTLALDETPRGFAGSWEYKPDLFDAATVARLAAAFETLLAGAAGQPGARLCELPLLSAAERHQLSIDWNETGWTAAGAGPEPRGLMHERFEQWADRTPDAVAVVAAGEALTYAELDRRANQFARRLRALGVTVDSKVGLCAERSPEMIVGLLGILKAGAAYVPLDPAYPAERLAFMVEDARMPVLLAEERWLGVLPETSAVRVRLDADQDEIARESGARFPGGALPESLAYVIYTSGTTGRPKGVMLPHRGWSSLADAQRRLFGVRPGDRVLQFASLSFDASAWEIAMALAAGAALVLGPRERLLSGEELAGLLGECTLATLPPAALALLPDAELPRLETLIVAGEACPVELARRWSRGRRFFNAYGPTEASVCATAQLYDGGERLPIGPPISRVEVYVLDAWGGLAPAGVAGELCLGGMGLARGYLHLPARTAERFVPHPFSAVPGERLYRTGDLARRRPDGEIELLGRADHQVKVRGFRIELGEVEAALAGHPAVREASVLAREDSAGERRLVAYLVPATAGLALAELRAWLLDRLPRHAVPTAFVELSRLPLTPNGKVDRGALPAPERPARTAGSETPRTEAERILAGVWAEVLRLPEVGVHDNFFELGGDSILSIQVVARAVRAGYRITPRQVFEHQTIASLAMVAETGAAVIAGQGPVTGPVRLTPIQRWFLGSDPVDPHHFNQSLLLAVRGPVSPAAAAGALFELVRHHDALRLRFAPGEAGWTAWNAAPDEAPPAWERIDLSGLEPARASAELSARAALLQATLDPVAGPLARGVWFDLPGGEARLLLALHHLAVDGVSWRVLLEDLETACRQLDRGEPVTLPAKTTSFQLWAERLSGHALAMPLEPERSWWLAEAEPGTARLPLDDPDGEDTEASTRWEGAALSAEETRALLQEVPAAFRTQINDVLLTALALALAGPGGSLTVALEGHGREEIASDLDLSRTVGWLTAVFPVRLQVPAGGDPVAALQAVKEHLRALPGRGLGYGLLRHLRDEEISRRLAALAWPEVSFNYLGQFDQVLPADSLFVQAGEPSGSPRSPRARRIHRLDVVGAVAGGRLRMSWGHGAVLRSSTVEEIAERFAAALRQLIAACRSAAERRVPGYTPSDFPLAGLDRQGLAALLGGEWGVEDIYPLSPLQEGMLFHTLYHPGSGVYVAQLLSRFQGELDERALMSACQRLVDRHGILRTSFHWHDLSRPLQVVHGRVEVSVELLDWRSLDPSGHAERLERLLREDRARGFDLGRAPVARWTLVRTGDAEHRLLWSHHHILLDGWSFSLLAAELLATWEALRRGAEPALPRHRPFRDYIAWLEVGDHAALEAYWRRTLAGWSEPTALPAGRESGGTAAGMGARLARLGVADTGDLQAQARRYRLTLNTFVQGAWGYLLGRYSGQDDVVFGSTVSGRPADLPGVESMVGLFINTLPVRLSAAEPSLLLPWLEELQARQAEVRQHEHSSLVEIQGWSEVPRGLPLFESILIFESYPRDESMREGGGELGVVEVRAVEQTSYPLTVSAVPGENMALAIEYDAARFEEVTVHRMLSHLRNLLAGMAAAPLDGGRRLADLPLLSGAERHQLLIGWSGLAARGREERGCLHEPFEAQAERTPGATAAVYAGEELSYGELERRANRLAHRLRALGVGPEVPVGICVERSLATLVAIFGVLKAGGAYVPLDPAYPADRLAFLLADARVPVLIADSSSLARLPAGGDLRTVLLDRDAGMPAGESDSRPSPLAGPGYPAYVIYTSGSTGRPKGVLVEHRSAAWYASTARDCYGLTPADRFLQFASLGFDISVEEIFPCLGSGGALVLATPAMLEPGHLLERCREQRVTAISVTPAVWHELSLLVEEDPERLPPSLRLVISGGDRIASERVLGWRRAVGDRVALFNSFGPTETTVACALYEVAGDPAGEVSIGRPLAGARLYLVDRSLDPVPAGAPGELCIGGHGVSRGYLGRPELTAERFIPDPFGGEPGARLYRSGDRMRWRGDGTLDFLGRVDSQVKIRGFRIEPGEIESVLRTHPRVRDAAVIARELTAGNRALVGYVAGHVAGHVAGTGQDLAPAALQSYLGERLPRHMVPAVFVFLPELPLTANGKIDRRALPAPARAESVAAPPRTPVEELLAEIFAAVLRRDRVGVEDDFFELGGHSLLATQVASRVRSAFHVELPLPALFEKPTVAALAGTVAALLAGGSAREAPPLMPAPHDGALPLSFAQERLWFLDRLIPGTATYNLPLALALRGSLSRPALAAALSALVARHEALRTTFTLVAGRPAQVVGDPFAAGPMVIDLRALPAGIREETARALAGAAAARPFDLGQGPLFRATLLRLEDDFHAVLLAMHHIVADGWSLAVLAREIGELYSALAAGRRPALPPLPVQYADFAAWQRDWLSGEVLEEQLGWWRQRLAGAPALLDLPLDRPRPPVQSFRGDRVPVRFPPALSARIAAWSRAHGATLFMTVLAGFQALLSRLSNQEDVVVGTPVANRNRVETEGLIGFFVNTLALRGRPERDLAFPACVGQVRETALGAYARQDLPFERVVEELQPERSLAHSPLFQVMLVLQNTAAGSLEIPGLRLEPFAPAVPAIAKFDLTLSLEETAAGLAGSLEYGADLFDEATALRIAAALGTLLAAAVERPEVRLSDLPLLSPAELDQALSAWNRAASPGIQPACLHELFERQAARTPEALAAVDGGESLTYRELDAAANRLARHLRHLGVGPEARVGLCLERSPRLLVGILGVLKAGGAWVPLDPATPPERMTTILEDALAGLPDPLLLTEEALAGLVPLPGVRRVRLDADAAEIARRPDGPISSGAVPDNLAYVIFTSGSTGRPKGVAVAHRGLASLIAAQARLFQIGPGSRVLQFASPGFDAAVAEIAVALATGATLHLASREELLPGPDLIRLLREREISVVTLPPSALAVMPPEPLPALRTLVVAGEACPPATARAWAAGRRLVNAYGPTEATVCASAEVFGEPDERLTLGYPTDNAALYGLDAALNPAPLGVTGELFLAGPGLARGYLGRPDLTAEAFRPYPWSAEPGGRLYRTGDAVRRLPDGRFELLGRLDRQVKIRGFRVELGEIEAALESCPAVRQAAVVLREDGGEKLLAVCVVGEIETAALRSFLAARLPNYMIPALFIPLAEMPLLPSGKPDRKALSRLPAGGAVEEGYVAPRTPVERALAGIFAETLRIERVGIRDDFFARGGHSLLAVGLMARIEERLGSRLPLATLFEGATVERLAGLLAKPLAVAESRALVAMQPRGSRPPMFCVHPIGGGVTGYYGHLTHHLGADQPFYGLQALELESREEGLEASVEGIAARYLAEVLALRPHGPYLLGGASYGGLIAFEMARQLLDRGEEVALLALIDTVAPRAWSAEEGTPEEPPQLDDAEQSFGMARALARMYGKELDLSLDELRGRPVAEVLERTLESVRAAGLAGPELDLAWALGYRESFNARIAGAVRYRARPYPDRLVLFRSSDSGGHSAEDLAVLSRAYDWGALAREVEVRWVPGDHETMLLEPNVQELALALSEFITAAGEPEIVGPTGEP
jgi:amino acid adenylation domain-containing protein/non-ribosomal peptide synthase protein (TIGR01720 family)